LVKFNSDRLATLPRVILSEADMTLFILLVMAPAFLWLWYFYRQDKRPEPVILVAVVFVAGGLSVIPVYHAERWLLPLLPKITPEQDLLRLFVSCTVVIGVVEELAKFSIVLLLSFWHHEFDEPVDGLVYAVAAAMGFTAGEDLLKYFQSTELRMFSPPAHALFAVFWGYALGQKLRRPSWIPVLLGLLLSIVAHGLWDTFAFLRLRGQDSVSASLLLAALAGGLFWCLESRIRKVQHPTRTKPSSEGGESSAASMDG
jgi:RsiW-degrading membrane proteinase PrsW (M82 family)